MKLIQVINTPLPQDKAAQCVSLVLAAILTVMVVTQLFKFEEFIVLLQSFELGGGEHRAIVIASVLVTVEVFALPFLLRMRLSVLMRFVSMALGWIAVVMWLYLMMAVGIRVNDASDAGFFGGVVSVPYGGWYSISFAAALVAGMAVSCWGFWSNNAKK